MLNYPSSVVGSLYVSSSARLVARTISKVLVFCLVKTQASWSWVSRYYIHARMLNTALLHKLRSMSTWALRLASNQKTLLASYRTRRAILRNAVAVALPNDAFSPPTKSHRHAWRPPRSTIPFDQYGAGSD